MVLEVRRVTEDNLDELAALTGRPAEALYEEFYSNKPEPTYILVGLPRREQ